MKKFILLFVSILIFSALYAKEETISKTFDTAGITTLKVESKYGAVKIENWDKAEIAVDVIIRAQSNKEQTVEKILSNVGVDFDQKREQLIVKTDFGMFFSFMKLSNKLFRNGDFSIDYHIKMPNDIALDLSLDNGNIILFQRNAPVQIAHSSGYISSESILGNSTFKLRNSHLKITQVDSLFLDTKGSTLAIDKALHIKGESYNSQFDIAEAQDLDVQSTRDKFTLQKISHVFINSSLSDIVIEELQTSGILDVSYGAISIQQIVPEFEEIKITSKGTTIALDLGNTPAHIAVSHHSSTKMNIPESMDLRMKFGESQKEFITTGTVGNPLGNSQILLNTKGGKLELK